MATKKLAAPVPPKAAKPNPPFNQTQDGDFSGVAPYLAAGGSPNKVGRRGQTLLFDATFWAHSPTVALLLANKKTNPNKKANGYHVLVNLVNGMRAELPEKISGAETAFLAIFQDRRRVLDPSTVNMLTNKFAEFAGKETPEMLNCLGLLNASIQQAQIAAILLPGPPAKKAPAKKVAVKKVAAKKVRRL